MLSKLVSRFGLQQQNNMLQMATRSFRASPEVNKKPSIVDAVAILQSKV